MSNSEHNASLYFTLALFQEMIMVLTKLRPNVPYQDLVYRFGVSELIVSRTFAHLLFIMDGRLYPLTRWPEREDIYRVQSGFPFGEPLYAITKSQGNSLLSRRQFQSGIYLRCIPLPMLVIPIKTLTILWRLFELNVLCSGQICWFHTKHFKAVNDNSCLISTRKLKHWGMVLQSRHCTCQNSCLASDRTFK